MEPLAIEYQGANFLRNECDEKPKTALADLNCPTIFVIRVTLASER
jgi:hypothetical protein